MGAPRDDIGALGQGLLEGAVQPEDVGHVVHEKRRLRPRFHPLGDKLYGLGIDEHTLSENDELGPRLFQELAQLLEVGPVGVFGQDREVEDVFFARLGVLGHEIEQGAHRLGAEVPALGQVVVHHETHFPGGLALGADAVDELDQALEHDFVRHLAADRAELDVGTAEVVAELLPGFRLDVPDEVRALVKIDLLPFHRAVLGVAPGGVGELAHLDQERGRRLGRDEVEALRLPPAAVLSHAFRQGLDFIFQWGHAAFSCSRF